MTRHLKNYIKRQILYVASSEERFKLVNPSCMVVRYKLQVNHAYAVWIEKNYDTKLWLFTAMPNVDGITYMQYHMHVSDPQPV